jgi:DNA-binding NarL/FixJ family response regulator
MTRWGFEVRQPSTPGINDGRAVTEGSGDGAQIDGAQIDGAQIDGAQMLSKPYPLLADRSVLLIDDLVLNQDYLATRLENNGASVTRVGNAASLVEELTRRRPALLILNSAMRGFDDILRLLAEQELTSHLIVFGLSEDRAIIACAEAGVAGYHLRSESLEDLLTFTQLVLDGNPGYSPYVAKVLVDRISQLTKGNQQQGSSVLTTREEEVLELLRLGLSNRQIAGRLFVTTHTVKNHVHNILHKLGYRSRAEAIAQNREG